MDKRGIVGKVTALIIASVLFLEPVSSFAFGGGHHQPRHHGGYPQCGRSSLWLPGTHISFSIGGFHYAYSEGVYYRKNRIGYTVVRPPVGFCAQAIPKYYQPVNMNGITYYTYDGIYYQGVPGGYVVVPQPNVVAVPAAPVVQNAAAIVQPVQETIIGSFTVNVPDNKGGYTAVTITRSGTGFVGPQKEYYAEFPSVEQLKAMYVR